ncbi:MAG: radical SAM protein [Bacteroidales bacterium]
MEQKLLLLTTPFTQLNTPYPATAYLKGFLNTRKIQSSQADLGIEVILNLFTGKQLSKIFDSKSININELSENSKRIIGIQQEYISTIEPVISFLQGKSPLLAHAICSGHFLPQASRFNQIDDLEWAFGTMGIHDKAKHLATLYLEDLGDFIKECIDPHFGFSRYAEHLGRWANEFDELEAELNKPETYIDGILFNLLEEKIKAIKPTLVGISIPFPGNLYSSFKCAQWIKRKHPEIKVVAGGGFVNTELRGLSDTRVFGYFDFICFDDGEIPLLKLVENLEGKAIPDQLKRTMLLKENRIVLMDDKTTDDLKHSDSGIPDYNGLPIDNYISVIEIVNPMHRLWSDGRWNKLTLAHGCYWAKCSFCDTTLDYIKRYDKGNAGHIADKIEAVMSQTGTNGFHFVDEAAPPALLRELAIEILKRKLLLVWWTNIRFEKNFTKDLCRLLAASGCIAVSGGLEVASERILKLINKGVTIEQVTRATDNFTRAGIMVHAYLMYGFPSQTAQETIDSLEVVRQLFESGVVQSGFWHHFAMTVHSDVGLNPEKYKARVINPVKGRFANNDVDFEDINGTDHVKFSEGLRVSLYNYMHGTGFDLGLQKWFSFKVPAARIPENLIENIIRENEIFDYQDSKRLIWLGNYPDLNKIRKAKKGKVLNVCEMVFRTKTCTFKIKVSEAESEFLIELLSLISLLSAHKINLGEVEKMYTQMGLTDFKLFWYGKSMQTLMQNGLLLI